MESRECHHFAEPDTAAVFHLAVEMRVSGFGASDHAQAQGAGLRGFFEGDPMWSELQRIKGIDAALGGDALPACFGCVLETEIVSAGEGVDFDGGEACPEEAEAIEMHGRRPCEGDGLGMFG